MYYSPVPLLVIRADTPALIEVNGHPAGECSADTHIALPLFDSGDYYINFLTISDSDNAQLYHVTRKIGFESGLSACPRRGRKRVRMAGRRVRAHDARRQAALCLRMPHSLPH